MSRAVITSAHLSPVFRSADALRTQEWREYTAAAIFSGFQPVSCRNLGVSVDRAADSRGGPEREKVLVRFLDGEVVRVYKDEAFSQEGLCFNLRLFDG
jgi:hypothetical protein